MKKLAILFLFFCQIAAWAESELIQTGYYLIKIKERDGIIVPYNIHIISSKDTIEIFTARTRSPLGAGILLRTKVDGRNFSGVHEGNLNITHFHGSVSADHKISGYFTSESVWEQTTNPFRYEFTILNDRSSYAPAFWSGLLSQTESYLRGKQWLGLEDSFQGRKVRERCAQMAKELDTTFTVSGKIVDDKNHPFSNAQVSIKYAYYDPNAGEKMSYKRIITSGDGTFVFTDGKGHVIDLFVGAPGYLMIKQKFQGVEELKKLKDNPLLIMLKTCEALAKEYDTEITINGQVIDSKGKPLSNARVYVEIASYSMRKTNRSLGELPQDGTFKLTGVVGHSIVVSVIKDRCAYSVKINDAQEIKKLRDKRLVITYKTSEEQKAERAQKVK